MSTRAEVLAFSVTEAQRLQINSLRHMLWVLGSEGQTLESAKQYLTDYIKELEAVAK